MLHHHFARLGQFAIAALLCCHIDNDAAGLHRLHHFSGDKFWRGLAGDQRGGDDDVDFFGLPGEGFALGFLEALAHHLGISTNAGAFLGVIDRHILATERFDLIRHFRPRVVRAHDRTQTRRRANRRQSGDSCADHKDFRRWHFARRRDLPGEKSPKVMCRLNHRAIAADIGHRGKCIEFLRTRNAWHAVHRHHGNFSGGEFLQQLRILRGPDETHQRRAFTHERDFIERRRAYFENNVGRRP